VALTKERFMRSLSLEAERGVARLYLSTPARRQVVAAAHRHRGHVAFFAISSGLGLSLHRNGGISLSGVPRSGGTSILWGAVNDRVKRLGQHHRAFHLGPIGIYIGEDF
jgi:hypothetical protein